MNALPNKTKSVSRAVRHKVQTGMSHVAA